MTSPTRFIHSALGGLALLALGACSGGGGDSASYPPAKTLADTLTYTNPTGNGGYLLVRDAASTSTHLILDLKGPATPTSLSGVGFYLSADQTQATWSNVGTGKVSSAVFTTPLVKTKLSADTLQVGVYQQGATPAISANATTVLAQIALDLKNNIPVNTTITLSAPAGKAAILNPPDHANPTSAVTISVGTLVAN